MSDCTNSVVMHCVYFQNLQTVSFWHHANKLDAFIQKVRMSDTKKKG